MQGRFNILRFLLPMAILLAVAYAGLKKGTRIPGLQREHGGPPAAAPRNQRPPRAMVGRSAESIERKCAKTLAETFCTYSCELDVEGNLHGCADRVSVQWVEKGVAQVELRTAGIREVNLCTEWCDPEGISFQVSDTRYASLEPSNSPATVAVSGSTLIINGRGGGARKPLRQRLEGFLPDKGCAIRRLVLTEQGLTSPDVTLQVQDPGLLSMEGMRRGLPQSWHLGLNTALDPRNTTPAYGVSRTWICMR